MFEIIRKRNNFVKNGKMDVGDSKKMRTSYFGVWQETIFVEENK